MKKISSILLVLALTIILLSCNSATTREKSWSEQQETSWKNNCNELLVKNGTPAGDAAEFCDCMFKKTAEKYTPKEAAALTEKQEQEIWEECDYQW